MEFFRLEWETAEPLSFNGDRFLTPIKLSGKKAALPSRELWMGRRGIGIDPGRKLGVAVLHNEELFAYVGKLGKEKTATDAIALGRAIAEMFPGFPIVLEDAAPSKVFYQVPLAEIRFGLEVGLKAGGAMVIRLRPNSIRKQAFGGGNIRATDQWPPLSEHAADAAAMALVAAGYKAQKGQK